MAFQQHHNIHRMPSLDLLARRNFRTWKELNVQELRDLEHFLLGEPSVADIEKYREQHQLLKMPDAVAVGQKLLTLPLPEEPAKEERAPVSAPTTVRTKFGEFVFTQHALTRIRERGLPLLPERFEKNIGGFDIAYSRSVKATFRHGYTIYLRSTGQDLILVISPRGGKRVIRTAYRASLAFWSRALDWIPVHKFEEWDVL